MPVMRELGCGRVARGRERSRDRTVQLGPLVRQQMAVEDLAHQAVAEGDPAVFAVTYQEARVEPASQRRQRVGRRGHAAEHAVVDPAAGDGDDREDPPRPRVEPLHSDEHGVGERRRDRVRLAAMACCEELLDEERVASRARVDLIHDRPADGLPGDRLELPPDLHGGQRREVQRRDRGRRVSSARRRRHGCSAASSPVRKVIAHAIRWRRRFLDR